MFRISIIITEPLWLFLFVLFVCVLKLCICACSWMWVAKWSRRYTRGAHRGCQTPSAWQLSGQTGGIFSCHCSSGVSVCVCVCTRANPTQGSFTPEPVRLTWGKPHQLTCFPSRNLRVEVKTDAVWRGDLSQTLCQPSRFIYFIYPPPHKMTEKCDFFLHHFKHFFFCLWEYSHRIGCVNCFA